MEIPHDQPWTATAILQLMTTNHWDSWLMFPVGPHYTALVQTTQKNTASNSSSTVAFLGTDTPSSAFLPVYMLKFHMSPLSVQSLNIIMLY
jgi:hypothetical protein